MKRILLSTLLATFLVSAGYYFYFSLPDVSVLKQKNPATTALMELREREYKKQNIRGPAPANLGVLRRRVGAYQKGHPGQ